MTTFKQDGSPSSITYQSPRKRSSSKTTSNYNPINSTSIATLSSPPPSKKQPSALENDMKPLGEPQFTDIPINFPLETEHELLQHQHTQPSQQKQQQQQQQPQIHLQQQPLSKSQLQSQSQSQKPSSPTQQQPQRSKTIQVNSRKLDKLKPKLDSNKPLNPLQKYVHVVKLVSPEQPNEYLKILSIPLYPDSLKIGRQNTPKTSNKITDGFFDSRVLSRNHAELFIKDNKLFIKDLKSSNGTFINESKLEPYQEYEIKVGDKIDLGTTLESQMAHKKITCLVKEFDYVSLRNFDDCVEEVISKDNLAIKRLELFNGTFDALMFGEVVDDEDDDDLLGKLLLQDGLEEEPKKMNGTNKNSKEKNIEIIDPNFITGLDLKNSKDMQDVIRKLIVSVNNEYIQQQRLKEINRFLKNYNNSVSINANDVTTFKKFEALLNHQLLSPANQLQESANIQKYSRMEEQLKSLATELNMVRKHLTTAKTKETESKYLAQENKSFKIKIHQQEKEVNSLKEELNKLNVHLSDFKEDQNALFTKKQEYLQNEIQKHILKQESNDKQIEELEFKNSKLLEKLKEQMKKPDLINKSVFADEQKPKEETKEHNNTESSFFSDKIFKIQPVSKYSGLMVLSLVLVYYFCPNQINNLFAK